MALLAAAIVAIPIIVRWLNVTEPPANTKPKGEQP